MNIFSWGETTIQKTVISYAQRAFTISPPISTSLINIRIVPAISSTAMAEYPCTGSLTGKASSLIHNRFGGNGLYLLDEPEAALSPSRILTLIAEVHELVQQNSQFLIATHSPMLMAYPYAKLLEFSEAGIQEVSYKDTEHYQLTRRFLEQPERYLSYLLEE